VQVALVWTVDLPLSCANLAEKPRETCPWDAWHPYCYGLRDWDVWLGGLAHKSSGRGRKGAMGHVPSLVGAAFPVPAHMSPQSLETHTAMEEGTPHHRGGGAPAPWSTLFHSRGTGEEETAACGGWPRAFRQVGEAEAVRRQVVVWPSPRPPQMAMGWNSRCPLLGGQCSV
jgi:hypothetical protein